MAQILGAEKEKKTVRLAVWLLHKKLGKSTEDIANDLKNCGNPVFREMFEVLRETCENIERPFQRKTAYEIGVIFLWIMYRDTAYKDPAYYGIMKILLRAPELLTMLKPLVKPPKHWYVNVWHQSKKNTETLKEEGKIPEYAKSPDEDIFVPSKQYRKLKKL
jgi:hypothetical protein